MRCLHTNYPAAPLKRTVLSLAVMLVLAPAALAQDFAVDWWTIDGGGAMLTVGGDFELSGTIGQPDAGVVMTGGDFELAGGFWAGGAEEPFCFGDLDGDNDIDLADLAQLLSNYGIPSGAVYEDGDLDLDGDVDLADLAGLLSVYGTTCP
jgi:hypothetical protein